MAGEPNGRKDANNGNVAQQLFLAIGARFRAAIASVGVYDEQCGVAINGRLAMRTRFQVEAIGTSFAAVSGVVLLMLAVAVTPAEARQKILSNGCTGAQIQSAKASQCIDKMEYDVRTNKPYTHALYCSSSGALLCCVYQDGQQLPASCEVLSGVPKPNQSDFDPNLLNGGTLDGGGGSPGGTRNDTGPLLRLP